jgi:hypothetical protein
LITFICDLAPSIEYLSHNGFTYPVLDFTYFNKMKYIYVDHTQITRVVLTCIT